MRKSNFFIASMFFLALSCSGCMDQQTSGNLNDHPLDGTWCGIGNAIGYGSDYSIDLSQLKISENGILTFDDNDQDTKDLSGSIDVDSDHSFTINVSDNISDMTLPMGWDDLKEEDSISYKLLNDSQLVLTYQDISYFFKKKPEGEKNTPDSSPLYDLGENNVWYSGSGEKNEDVSYELQLYHQYMELYEISDKNEQTLISSFYGLSNEGDSFTFYTRKISDRPFPNIFSSLPEGLSTLELTLRCEDDTLTMSYGEKTLTFYNNVIH